MLGVSELISGVLAHIPASDLRVHVVWLPMLNNDTREEAQKAADALEEPRITHYWDAIANQGTVWNHTLGLPPGQMAWDLFVVLPRGATWKSEPPAPAYWCHQLRWDGGIRFSPPLLRKAVEEALAESGAVHSPTPATKE